jgi:hypothetical protein
MTLDLKLAIDATTINRTEGTIVARGHARNAGDRPVALMPSQLVVELADDEGRPVPFRHDGLERYPESTLRPDESLEFAATVHASHIKLGRPYTLTVHWPELSPRHREHFRFRQVDPA